MQKIKRVGVLACAAFIALSLATPASATWYIFIEVASVEPSNAGITGGTFSSFTSGPGTFSESNSALFAEIGEDVGGTVGFGFDALGGVIGVAYTTSSGDETSPAGSIDSNGTPGIFFEGFGGNFYAPETGSASVFGDIERSTIDVMYFNFMNPGEGKVTTHWTFGLRSATYEEMIRMTATGDADGGGNPSSLVDNYMLDVDALGVMFGGGAEVALGEKFSIYGNLNASILMSETEETVSSTLTFVGFTQTNSGILDRDGSGLIWDVSVGASVFRSELVQIGVEYQLSSWNGLVGRQLFGSDDLSDSSFTSRESVAFHGIAVNALFRIGDD